MKMVEDNKKKVNPDKRKKNSKKNVSSKNKIKYDYKTFTASQIEIELKREKYKSKYFNILSSTVYGLIIISAIALIVATLIMPVFQISGSSMNPTYKNGDFVVSVKSREYKSGDVIAFYYGNKTLVKRIIATSNQWVVLDKEGNVYVDGVLLDEPYINKKEFGEVDVEFPYQVPNNSLFVLSDNRSNYTDSRSSNIGSISEDDVISKILFRLWGSN